VVGGLRRNAITGNRGKGLGESPPSTRQPALPDVTSFPAGTKDELGRTPRRTGVRVLVVARRAIRWLKLRLALTRVADRLPGGLPS